jgi:uncharacterized protein YecE (DUF72 family)
MRVRIGTSGFSYKKWRGVFYPDDLPASEMLRFYASQFGSVELNNTFYRMPTAATLSGWAEQVPHDFCFALKASRHITHQQRLKQAGEAVAFLCEQAQSLGDRLGPLLFQLPPNFRKDVGRLSEFVALLPAGQRAAFEFRHPSWSEPDVCEVLRQVNAALCVADVEGPPPAVVTTANWGYLRLRRTAYSDAELAHWAAIVRAQPWDDAYVYFKHEDKGTGPALARQFASALAGAAP